jgi:hypothetical protein
MTNAWNASPSLGKGESNERLIGLLEYIEQVEKLKKIPEYRVATEPLRRFQSELRGLPGIAFDVNVNGEIVWMRVARCSTAPHTPASINASNSPRSCGRNTVAAEI